MHDFNSKTVSIHSPDVATIGAELHLPSSASDSFIDARKNGTIHLQLAILGAQGSAFGRAKKRILIINVPSVVKARLPQ